jgi:hypothetical protein
MKLSHRWLFLLLAFGVLLGTSGRASAFQGVGPQRKEVDLVMNRSYDVFIGNSGVYMDNSRHIGTLVLNTSEWPDRPNSWHMFTQHLLDVRVYNKEGDPFTTVYGLVRVYFNLDDFQWDKWRDEDSNMSIWYFDELNGGWYKCTTHWEQVPGEPKGRLWCLVHRYALYGVAYTKPTLLMKLIKAGLVPTPTP